MSLGLFRGRSMVLWRMLIQGSEAQRPRTRIDSCQSENARYNGIRMGNCGKGRKQTYGAKYAYILV